MINFTGKILKGTCEITDKATYKKIPAKFIEYDGKDKSDSFEFKKAIKEPTPFMPHMIEELKRKSQSGGGGPHRIFTIETSDGEIVANAHIEEKPDGAEIIQIGANKNRYGLSGQNLIAHLGHELIDGKTKTKLSAFAPVPDAVPFYTWNCKFKYDKDYNLYAEKKELDELYKKLDCRTVDVKI